MADGRAGGDAAGGALLAPMALHAASAVLDVAYAPGADDRLVVELPSIEPAIEPAIESAVDLDA